MPKTSAILLAIAFALLAVGSAPLSAPGNAQEAPQRPNILLIVTDDQRADTIEAMPRTWDLFAKKGTAFTDAYATTPLCCPSRASILTGLYAHNHRVKTQDQAAEPLDLELTIQRYLSEAGYYTGLIGKWLNGWDLRIRPPHLSEVAIFTSSKISYETAHWNVDGAVEIINRYSTEFMTERATGFIERAETEDEAPWLLVLTPPQPHAPFDPQQRFSERRFSPWEPPPSVGEEDTSDKPPLIEGKVSDVRKGRRLRTSQMRTLLSVDEMIADTFDTLVANGEATNTLAVFTSDNGYMWGEHGVRNIKRFPYTEAVKVPMYVRWPGHVAAGTADDRIVANIDLAPTVLEAAGLVERAAELDGRSLLQPSSGREKILLEYWPSGKHPLPTWASSRSKDIQYIEYYDSNGVVTYREYYDLATDPFQLENLLDNGDVLDDPEWLTLSTELRDMRDCSGESCP